jgi:hypothetical protein
MAREITIPRAVFALALSALRLMQFVSDMAYNDFLWPATVHPDLLQHKPSEDCE